VSVAEAPVVAKAKPLPVSKERECLTVQTWGKPEEHGARSWLKGLVARMGCDGVAKATGLESESLAGMTRGAAIGAAEGEAIVAVEMPEGEALTREQRRSRRPPGPRAYTISTKRMTKREQEENRVLYPAEELARNDALRPKKRSECEAARGYDESGKQNPCPFVSCQFHLLLDVSSRTNAIKVNFPDALEDLSLMPDTCTLDVVDRNPNGATLEYVGARMSWTRERQRQVETMVMAKLAAARGSDILREFTDEEAASVPPRPGKSDGKRRLPVLRVVRGGLDEG
jgi:hypothetical protein